ncbi:MAG: tRNA methyl transferase PRC-barrel domain-containing protein, partial [Brachybacterium tyrofermentans]
EILDDSGAVIGTHRGTHGFTIGQRKGLGIQQPAADGAPRYVVDIDPSSRQVVVGAAELLSTRELIATDVVSFEPLSAGREVRAQIRAHGEATPARILEAPESSAAKPAHGPSLRVGLETPIRGVAPGQTLVLYDGDRVIAAATLERRA